MKTALPQKATAAMPVSRAVPSMVWHRPAMAALMLLAVIGCNDGTASQRGNADVVAQANIAGPSEPGTIELERATAVLDDLGIVRFTIHYRFTSGAPTKFYQCDITFVDADRYGIKPMMAYELSPAGSFTTGIEVGDAPVKEYTITMSEAESPDRG